MLNPHKILITFAIIFFGLSSKASAVLVGLGCITSNSGQCTSLAPQLALNVTDAGSNQTLFELVNNGPIPSSATQVYWDDNGGVLLSIASILGSAGTAYSAGGSPPNLPAGNTVGFTADFRVTPNAPTSPNGVGISEFLQVKFNIVGGKTFNDVVTALSSNALRVGVHVQSIGTSGQSDSLVSGGVSGSTVPEPMSLLLLGGGIAGLAAKRRHSNSLTQH